MFYLFLLAEKNKVRSSNITLALSIGVRALGEGCRLGGFPKVVVWVVSPREKKGSSGKPETAAGIFLEIMDTLWVP